MRSVPPSVPAYLTPAHARRAPPSQSGFIGLLRRARLDELVAFKASLCHCFGCGLTGLLYGDGSLLTGFLGVFDRYLGALFGSVVGGRAGVGDALAGSLRAFYGRLARPLDGLLRAVSGLDDHGLGAFIDTLHNPAHGVNYVLRHRSLPGNSCYQNE